MASQKIENLLNLALDATQEEREKSLELEVGYDPEERVWDLIVKYSGNLEAVRELASNVVELQNEYAIITVRESDIDALTQIPEIEYIEKPKRLFFEVVNGRRVSCIRTQISGMRTGRPGFAPCGTSRLHPARAGFLQRGMGLGRSIRQSRLMMPLSRRRWRAEEGLCQVWIPPGMGRRWPGLQPETAETVTGFMPGLLREVNC